MPREKAHHRDAWGELLEVPLPMHCRDDQLPHAKLHNHQLPIRHIPKNISIHYHIILYIHPIHHGTLCISLYLFVRKEPAKCLIVRQAPAERRLRQSDRDRSSEHEVNYTAALLPWPFRSKIRPHRFGGEGVLIGGQQQH